jgi:cysteinyl-tRNA synthetase
MNFTWKSAQAAQEAFNNLREQVLVLRNQTQRSELSKEKLGKIDDYRERFKQALSNDLQIPQAVATMWEMLKSNVPSPDKLDLLFEFDQVLGLNLSSLEEEKIPEEIQKLAEEREKARQENNFVKADELRKLINTKGYLLEDAATGFRLKKKT